MESCTHIFQISGIKNCDKKRDLIQGIQHLSGKYLGGSIYQQAITHLIIPEVISSEKFFAACAAGKWVVTPDYVLDSLQNGCWLTEDQYEVSIGTDSPSAFYPVRQWREKVASRRITGAFEGWRVLLMVQEPSRRDMFKRLLVAGKAEVYDIPPPSHSSITHVMAKPITENSQSYSTPCYSVTHVIQHLFGRHYVHMNFANINVTDSHPTEIKKPSVADIDLSELEAELRDYVIQHQSRPRLQFLEFLGYHDPYCSQLQATETDFSNVGSMIECGLFAEALDSIRSAVLPGLLPPVAYVISLLEYALQGDTTPYFQKNFLQFMINLLLNNPPLLGNKGKTYFKQVLQCPRCKMGIWPFLQSTISRCLSSEATCHPLPAPASPALIRFYCDLVTFVLRLFQVELHSVTAGDFGQPQGTGVSKAPASGFLLNATFWTFWERATLLSQSVKQLCHLLFQAATKEFTEKDERQSLHLTDTLLNFLSVVVEFWCHQHNKLNWNLAYKGLKDLVEHLAVVSRDVTPAVAVELVVRVSSTRLKMTMADAVFRSLCCRNGFTLEDNSLSLKEMVLSYLPFLGHFAHSPSDVHRRTEPTSTTHSGIKQETNCRTQCPLVKNSLEKGNVPRGLTKVNAAGETLLHRACMRCKCFRY
ncbi:SMC5-SMC6 complex localization factor protein 1 isoform X2 [Cynoglossus semilaevis]|uniref:SMC5-SMC6 complex localization factor protein 1 isoform X2 n=1 Tax=Cynoglossus semilaevis TaxID=244447 RepID=UPI000D62E8DE|nr:SMC5-SMC6 complex localization factor protein 1 isoform X2 [Cynoglossus semilaevis]